MTVVALHAFYRRKKQAKGPACGMLQPQRGAFTGVLHAQMVASKNRCFATVRSV